MSWLDFKLGARMLIKYPGLTLVGGVAIAFAIAVGAAAFDLVNAVVNPTLPLEDGSRIVALRNWDPEANAVENRASYDFLASSVLPSASKSIPMSVRAPMALGSRLTMPSNSARAAPVRFWRM